MRTLALAALLAALAPAPAAAEALPEDDPGRVVLESKGCVACHSLDGSAKVGPTFLGLAGDADFFRESILHPEADLAQGYAAGTMPKIPLSDADLDAAVAALVTLGGSSSTPAEPGPLWPLLLGLCLFVGGHLVVSSHGIRSRLVAKLGLARYQGAYSLLALVGLGVLIWGYVVAPYVALWPVPTWTYWIAIVGMVPMFILFIAGVTTPSPTAVGGESTAEREDVAEGVLAITRHPSLWAYTLWAAVHIPANGDLASLLLFGGIIVLCVGGMIHIDRRKALQLGARWETFAAKTSLVPFAALLAGRTRLRLKAFGVWRLALALVLYAAMLFGHEHLIGKDPLLM